ncbi:MAG: MarP family serine protease, partial [Candidatus Dormibacteria bacterium]
VGISVTGLVVGVVTGANVAPAVARDVATDAGGRALVVALVFIGVVVLAEGIASAIGVRVRLLTLRTRLAALDSGLGALVATVGVLATAWYMALVFSNGPSTGLERAIRSSVILRALDAIAPRPPGFLADLEQALRGAPFPLPFAQLAPDTPGPLPLPPLADTSGLRTAAGVTSKVQARGCGGVQVGSSWPVGDDLVVTNAHVVAGTDDVRVQTPDGRSLAATVVVFDPRVDVALLRVRGIGYPSLPIQAAPPQRGTPGITIGYPGGGPRALNPAVVRGTLLARGRDIYGSTLVTRSIEVLTSQVVPGSSGGPLVDHDGRVIGVIFAVSTADPSEGYALTTDQVADDIAVARQRSLAVSTPRCVS